MQRSETPPSDDTRTIRVVAWVAISLLAGVQAYANRYAVSPDGISYLDLSDAVVQRDWSRLVNLYWSPLYPALIGIARLVAGTAPTSELQIMHAVNFAIFVAMFAAFDYMLAGILVLARRTPRSMLPGRWGLAAAYVLFAFFTLTMLPQELTTPDLLSGTSMFAVFGALLRLRERDHSARDAAVLGVSLGIGALAKSFMVPWALVCFAVAFVAVRGRGFRVVLIAGVTWAVIVAPWTAVLTHAARRFTFGDTGRLTYTWYVNGEFPPSAGGVPPGARTLQTDAILPGTGVTGPAPGTDPMWFDPARWNSMLEPHWSARDQAGTLKALQAFYVRSLTPLLFLILLITTAPRGSRRDVWWNGWVVYVPAAAGVVAYALVLVTARYVMPFVLATTLTVLATTRRPRRMLPLLAALGIAVPLGMESMNVSTIVGLVLIASIIGGMMAGAFLPTRSRILWGTAVIAASLVVRVLLPPAAPGVAIAGAFIVGLLFWLSARAAIRAHRSVRFAQRAFASLALLLTAVFAVRFAGRAKQDVVALTRAQSPQWGNVPVKIANDLASRGITPGTRVAVVGPHAEAYWARAGRLNIVASVPRSHVAEFWALPPDRRDALLREFAAAGATVAIASMGPAGESPDPSWTPVKFRGWIRSLVPASQ